MNIKMAGGFCRRFGVGLRAGADLIQLLAAEGRNGSDQHRQAINTLKEDAQQGAQLSKSMEKHTNYFPPLLRSMTRVGEATGRLEHVMLNLADHYDKQLSLQRSFRKSIIWPGIQLVGGILVISLLIYLMGILGTADILGFGLMGGEGVLKFWGYLSIVFGATHRHFLGVQNQLRRHSKPNPTGLHDPEDRTSYPNHYTFAFCVDFVLRPRCRA